MWARFGLVVVLGDWGMHKCKREGQGDLTQNQLGVERAEGLGINRGTFSLFL